MAYINFLKGWPSQTAVDIAAPVHADHTDIVTGMCIYLSSGSWKKGCPKGSIPYVTGPFQSPTALDVYRRTATTFSNGVYPAGSAEMGQGNMGGIALTNAIEFQTDQYTSLTGGEVVYAPTTGKFTQATTADHQICGVCRRVATDPASGSTVATIVASPVILLP